MFLTIAIGLIFRTDLDNPLATQLVGEGAFNVDADFRRLARRKHSRKSSYDSLLLVTFIIMVGGALLVTGTMKMVMVARAMASSDRDSGGWRDALMRAAYGFGWGCTFRPADLADFGVGRMHRAGSVCGRSCVSFHS